MIIRELELKYDYKEKLDYKIDSHVKAKEVITCNVPMFTKRYIMLALNTKNELIGYIEINSFKEKKDFKYLLKSLAAANSNRCIMYDSHNYIQRDNFNVLFRDFINDLQLFNIELLDIIYNKKDSLQSAKQNNFL